MAVDYQNQVLENVANPTNPQEAATKDYVDTQIAAISGGLANVIATDTTYTFGSTGTYANCKAAKDFLADYFILPGVVVTLQASGTLTEVPFSTDHAQEEQIQYLGVATEGLTFSSSVSMTDNGAGDHDWVIQLTSVGTCAVGQYVLIRAITGTGEIGSLAGCHKITNVNSGANRITLKLKDKSATIGSFTVSGMTIKKHNSMMDFSASLSSGQAGITIVKQPLKFNHMVIIGNPSTAQTDGVQLRDGYWGDCFGQDFSIADQGRHGIYAFEGTTGEIVDVCISNCVSSGLKVEANASLAATRVCISGCGNGATVNTGYILMNSSLVGGCTRGVYSNDRGLIVVSGYITGCTTAGIERTTNGRVTDLGVTFSSNAANLVGHDESWGYACSDETTNLSTGTAKVTFKAHDTATLVGVAIDVNTAPTGSTIIVDINKNGSTILSTKLTIDVGEKSSITAATPAVITDTAIAVGDEYTIDIDQVGSTVPGKGLKAYLLVAR